MNQEFQPLKKFLKPIAKLAMITLFALTVSACGPETSGAPNPTAPQPSKQKICITSEPGDTINKIVGKNHLDPYSTNVTVDQNKDGTIDYNGLAFQGPNLQYNKTPQGLIVDEICLEK